MGPERNRTKQVTGNVGLYYVCYHLSRLGWNVMNTARNAKGVDVFATNQSGTKTFTIQVKTLSKPNWTTVGKSPLDMTADYLVVCDNLDSKSGPRLFVAPKNRVRNILTRDNGTKPEDGIAWLDAKRYRTFDGLENVIGPGFK